MVGTQLCVFCPFPSKRPFIYRLISFWRAAISRKGSQRTSVAICDSSLRRTEPVAMDRIKPQPLSVKLGESLNSPDAPAPRQRPDKDEAVRHGRPDRRVLPRVVLGAEGARRRRPRLP